MIGCHTDIYLKAIVEHDEYSSVQLYYSQDGIAYHYLGGYDLNNLSMNANKIGLISVNESESHSFSTIFNYFRISTTVEGNTEEELPSGNRIYYKLK
jgi:hypothetical protein